MEAPRRSDDHPLEAVPDLVPRKCIDRETIQESDTADLAERAGLDEETIERVFLALAEFECERHPWRDPRLLARLYYHKGLTQAQIGERVGVTQHHVSEWMKRYDIAPGKTGPLWSTDDADATEGRP